MKKELYKVGDIIRDTNKDLMKYIPKNTFSKIILNERDNSIKDTNYNKYYDDLYKHIELFKENLNDLSNTILTKYDSYKNQVESFISDLGN